jgi:hypothetical protein
MIHFMGQLAAITTSFCNAGVAISLRLISLKQ